MKPLNSIAAALAIALLAHPAAAREQIRIVGSSTVYPFSAAVAEKFGRVSAFRTPVVESTGTGGGFKLFCEGVGPATPDISDASRRILPEEEENCRRNGIGGIIEIPVGFDGIVFAGSAKGPHFRLTKADLFKALARQVPVSGGLAGNPYRRWNEVNPSLPDLPIVVYGTPPTSGTRDTFVEVVMDKACVAFAEFKAAYPDERDRKKACGELREDGAYIEAGENGNVIVQKLIGNPNALGIFGYSFLEQNGSFIQAAPIDGTAPAFASIQSGSYPVSRKLYIYVKRQHLGIVQGIKDFLEEYTGENAFGPDGYLADQGLIPLPDAERQKDRALVAALK